MNDKVKGLVVGLTIGSLLTGATAFAASGMNINVVVKKLSIFVDETKKTSADGFIYKGTTYVPVKSVGATFGKQVGLYGDSLYIGKQPAVKITEVQAIQLVRNKYGIKASSDYFVEVDHSEGNNYVVHVYEVIMDDETTGHTATYGWYYVDKSTGKIESMF
ncbi:hypothetical protein GCM10010912_22300 [Paenibacillus albidus]|uniref:Copper amine oxidase n=1 Tax=Paenibacillus albidus TaxID=2041023 RepID=A0A917C944_9BACL|nr:hypothetical protein [Paenibacillus albidus]GGF76720.1 hypothetical protein GCM10010912_22300 [Paenibacillus albidus]